MHETFMRRCLYLASRARGRTGMNPMVGSVIVHKGKIIGEGFHREFGSDHAEVNAVQSVVNKDLLRESTLYVNLEPCSHYGKTPPCSELITYHKIPEVVIGTVDPNPLVSGKGIKHLSDRGTKILTPVLEKECLHLNRRFFTNILKKRPYVILKWAQSRDGYIDKNRKSDDPMGPNWITDHTARILVHKWRSEEGGIMAGTNTVLTDDPGLDVRYWPGRNPVRIIPDRKGRLSGNLKVLDGSTETLIIGEAGPSTEGLTTYIKVKGEAGLAEILELLLDRGIYSLIVEGGARLINSFLNQGLWDEARVFEGDTLFGSGIPSPAISAINSSILKFRNNLLRVYVNSESSF